MAYDTSVAGRVTDALTARHVSFAPKAGCRPMDFTGRPMKGYIFVHPEGHNSDSQLGHWVELALAFNPKAKAAKKRSGRRR